MDLRILSAKDVKQALPMAEAIKYMKLAYQLLSSGMADVPLRPHVSAENGGTTLVMPAYVDELKALAVKVVSVFPQNVGQGLPAINGLVTVISAETGRPLALLEGAALTAIRTGAGSGAATDLLANPDAEVVTILGSGVQARTQLEAVCTVRKIKTVYVYSPNQMHAAAFVAEMAGQGPIPEDVRVAGSAATAVAAADIICAATTSSTPVFAYADLKQGVHINGVGSFLPTMQEVDVETVSQAQIFVDSREGALAEAGDLLIPLQSGLITEAHIQAELGEVVAGEKNGRTDPTQITFFKSVGNAAQDAVAGQLAWNNALKLGLGTTMSL